MPVRSMRWRTQQLECELVIEVIAEAGVTHLGSLSTACHLADTARAAGAQAFKIQTFNPHKLYKNPPETLLHVNLSHKDTVHLAKHCERIGIEFMSTPGDLDSLKFLVESVGVKRIKIGSDDLTYEPLTEAAYKTDLPVILSTGMATYSDVVLAMSGFGDRLTLMHCMSLYPTPIEHANLGYIETLKNLTEKVGYSDHTQTPVASFMAMAMGVCMIEKHICPDGYSGPDANVSMIPLEFRLFMSNLREYEKLLGNCPMHHRPDRVNVTAFRKGPDGTRD